MKKWIQISRLIVVKRWQIRAVLCTTFTESLLGANFLKIQRSTQLRMKNTFTRWNLQMLQWLSFLHKIRKFFLSRPVLQEYPVTTIPDEVRGFWFLLQQIHLSKELVKFLENVYSWTKYSNLHCHYWNIQVSSHWSDKKEVRDLISSEEIMTLQGKK